MNIENIKQGEWNKYFGGKWSILSASYWGQIYTSRSFTKTINQYVKSSIIVINQDTGLTGYFKKEEVDLFSGKLGELIAEDDSIVSKMCSELTSLADSFMEFLDQNIGKDISWQTYQEYTKRLEEYYILHIKNKYAPEGLTPALLEKHMDAFEAARVHVEPVFMRTEEFMRNLADIHAKKTGVDKKYILSMIDSEFHDYLQNGTLPDIELLKQRFEQTVLLSQDDKAAALVGEEAEEVVDTLKNKNKDEDIRGAVGFPGYVKGTARLVLDPRDPGNFQEGDILVTKMTRPDYLYLMKKASAFVTDGGGILCHAAIVARELKTPCIIGTQVASEKIKDGDQIEVDANNGIIRIIK